MSQFEKFLKRIYQNPIPKDITYNEMAKFLVAIRCTIRKKTGTSHRQFKYPGYFEVITLMEDENVKEYQVRDVRELLDFIREEQKQ